MRRVRVIMRISCSTGNKGGGVMRKGRYNLTLPAEQTEKLRSHLEARGESLSGFVGGIITEYVKELEGELSVLRKPFDEVTAVELMQWLGRWTKNMQDLG